MWLIDSSIGRKLVMSVSGLGLILFLTFHMAMNAVALFSGEGYNMVCEFLGANWYALVATVGLAALVVVHIVYAFILQVQNRRARGNQRYAVTAKPKGVEWASQNMLMLGIIVILGLALHLVHFWSKMQLAEIMHHMQHADEAKEAVAMMFGNQEILATNGAALIAINFSNPVIVVLYVVWLAAIWFHLSHGFWSALHTIGWNGKNWLKRLECISNVYTTIIVLGFIAVPILFFVQSLMDPNFVVEYIKSTMEVACH